MKISKNEKNRINNYFEEMGYNCHLSDNLFDFVRSVLLKKDNDAIVASNWFFYGIAKVRGMRRYWLEEVLKTSEQYFAIKDALLLLASKGCPTYFFNRVGMMKSGYSYANSAIERMHKSLSFPKMVEDIPKYDTDFKELFGEKYSQEYIKEISKIPQVIQKGNLYVHEDIAGKYVNVVNGNRITINQPDEYVKTIHVYGRCGAFGYAVEDCDTMPSLLQKQLLEEGYSDIRVVNHGLWGGTDDLLDHNFLHEAIGYTSNDIVIFYRKHFEPGLIKKFEELGLIYHDLTKEWHDFPEAKWCFYDKPGHMNSVGYENVSKIITKFLINHRFSAGQIDKKHLDRVQVPALNEYLKKSNNSAFENEISKYIASIISSNLENEIVDNAGGIVMNCNPFTKGHRYLIEYAASQVERLYIFVVEEDKSFFKFEDRFHMVKEGTKDLMNVVVVPSGKFIISSFTFPEYFMKDYVKEKNFDVSKDLEMFATHIAPPLRIKKRFVGEEPLDPVTNNYNMSMKKIFPQYGIELCEIPRLTLTNEKIINATEVRRLLQLKDIDGLREFVPESTMKVLIEKYI